ncbi:MAG: hypothetical protein ACMG5Z_08200, partial [Luteimonas sp.]
MLVAIMLVASLHRVQKRAATAALSMIDNAVKASVAALPVPWVLPVLPLPWVLLVPSVLSVPSEP